MIQMATGNTSQVGVVLIMQMGIGKTVVALATRWEIDRDDREKPTLILCKKISESLWTDELTKWLKPTEKGRVKFECLTSSGNRTLNSKNAVTVDYVITTYNHLVTVHGSLKESCQAQRCQEAFGSGCLYSIKRTRIICDESQYFKNPKSKRFAAVNDLHSNRRLCLCRSPMMNVVDDIKTQLDFCGYRHRFEDDENVLVCTAGTASANVAKDSSQSVSTSISQSSNNEGKALKDIDVNLKLTVMKSLHAQWLVYLYLSSWGKW